jgi:hypothetical protein
LLAGLGSRGSKDQHLQTYDANVARGYYFTTQYGDRHGISIFPGESKAGHDAAFATGADKVDGLGVYAWAAAVAFRDALNATVKAHGINGLTRANLFAALNQIHAFDADGMIGTIDRKLDLLTSP